MQRRTCKLRWLDLNNPVFQEQLLALEKAERPAALDTLNKIRQLTWNQLYLDAGIKWEKITSINPPEGIDAVYSLRMIRRWLLHNSSQQGLGVGKGGSVVLSW